MQAPIQVNFDGSMGLRDAIAYEFYMDHVKDMMEVAEKEEQDVFEAVKKLARGSYAVADIFLAVRDQTPQDKNESSTEES